MSKILCPVVMGLNKFECAKYARQAALTISGAYYNPANAWDFGIKSVPKIPSAK